jgi:hypothetical protein
MAQTIDEIAERLQEAARGYKRLERHARGQALYIHRLLDQLNAALAEQGIKVITHSPKEDTANE